MIQYSLDNWMLHICSELGNSEEAVAERDNTMITGGCSYLGRVILELSKRRKPGYSFEYTLDYLLVPTLDKKQQRIYFQIQAP